MRFLYTAPYLHTNQHCPIKGLLEAGHEVSFLALTRNHSEEHAHLAPIILGFSPFSDPLLRVFEKIIGKHLVGTQRGGTCPVDGIPPILKFWNEVRRRSPATVIVRNPQSAYGLLSVLVAKLTGSHLIFYTQCPKHRQLKASQRLLRSFALWSTGAKWITPVLGTPGRDEPINGLCYVPLVIEPQTSPKKKSWFGGGAINILTVGRYQHQKKHRLFLEVVHRLSRRYPIRATIIGACTMPDHQQELENLKKYGRHLGISDIIDFKVNLSFPEMQEQYPKYDIFALSSRDDVAAMSPLEAMAHSLPVVCSDSNGTQCYIQPGRNGFVFRTDDLDDFEACLSRILESKKKLVEMGRHSYELVASEHAPARYVNTLVGMSKR